MTEKQTKRFDNFTFSEKDNREDEKTKNGFHHHEVKLL